MMLNPLCFNVKCPCKNRINKITVFSTLKYVQYHAGTSKVQPIASKPTKDGWYVAFFTSNNQRFSASSCIQRVYIVVYMLVLSFHCESPFFFFYYIFFSNFFRLREFILGARKIKILGEPKSGCDWW